MKEIKYIALDLDGTLTNSKKEITPLTRDALIKCEEKGIKLILASGRPTPGLYREAKELKMDEFGGFLVSFNGARIHEYPSMKCLKEMTLSVEEAKSLVAQARKFPQFSMMTYDNESIICEGEDEYRIKYEAMLTNMPIKVVNSMEEYIDHPINKLLFAVEPELMKELEEPFKAPFTNLSLYCSTPFYLEAMTNGIDKAETLIELTKMFNDSVENMMAFGDGFNDCKMLKAAGVGVCMSNGDDRCKAIADYIAKSNDEDGIKYALDELLPEIVK